MDIQSSGRKKTLKYCYSVRDVQSIYVEMHVQRLPNMCLSCSVILASASKRIIKTQTIYMGMTFKGLRMDSEQISW